MLRFLRNSALIFSATALALVPSALRAGENGGKFKILKKLPLEGGGRWDYVTTDPEAHRVYIARSTHVTVLDSESGAVVGDIPDTPGVHGVALAPDLGIGFISEGGAAKVAVFDLKSLKVESTIATGENPDSIVYHPATHQVFVQNGKSKSTSVIDAKTKKVVATIPLDAKPEYFAYDQNGNIFINLEDKHAIAVIDASSRKVKATWPLEGCEGPSGLTIDTKTHTLFSSCDAKLMVVDSNSGKVRQSVAIGDDCDAVSFDPGTGNVFASPSTGKFQIIHADKSGKYSVVQEIDTPVGSKTHGLDPSTHKVYLPSAKFAGDPSKRPRPSVVDGTIQVLVVGE